MGPYFVAIAPIIIIPIIKGPPIFNVFLNWTAELAEQHKTISKERVLHEATEDLEEEVVMDIDYADHAHRLCRSWA